VAKPASIETNENYVTNCPHCGCDHLMVVEVTLVNGKKHYPGTPLTDDGFIVDPNDELLTLDDQSTEDEVVLCPECRTFMPLEELML